MRSGLGAGVPDRPERVSYRPWPNGTSSALPCVGEQLALRERGSGAVELELGPDCDEVVASDGQQCSEDEQHAQRKGGQQHWKDDPKGSGLVDGVEGGIGCPNRIDDSPSSEGEANNEERELWHSFSQCRQHRTDTRPEKD